MKTTLLLLITLIIQHALAIPIILNKDEKKDDQQLAQMTKEQINAKKKLRKKGNAGVQAVASEKIEIEKLKSPTK